MRRGDLGGSQQVFVSIVLVSLCPIWLSALDDFSFNLSDFARYLTKVKVACCWWCFVVHAETPDSVEHPTPLALHNVFLTTIHWQQFEGRRAREHRAGVAMLRSQGRDGPVHIKSYAGMKMGSLGTTIYGDKAPGLPQ